MRYISKIVPMITADDIKIMEIRTPGIAGSFNITPITDKVRATSIAHTSVIRELGSGEYIDIYDTPVVTEIASGWSVEFAISEA